MNTPTSLTPGENLSQGGDDNLVLVPEHRNDLHDWCPRSGERTADGTCPVYCAEADRIVGFDAGRDEDEEDEDEEDEEDDLERKTI